MKNKEQTTECELCERDVPSKRIEKHHFEPKKKKQKEGSVNVALVCNPCGDQLHQLFTNKELEKEYNTIEKLKAHPKVQKWIAWVRKNNPTNVCMKRKKRKR